MARKNRKYMVSYKVKNAPGPTNVEVEAQDVACALGLVLDALEDDGKEPAFEWVLLRTAVAARKQEAFARQAMASSERAITSALGSASLRVRYDVTDKKLRDSGLLDGYVKAVAEAKLS